MNGSDPAFFRALADMIDAGEPCATAQIVRVAKFRIEVRSTNNGGLPSP